MARLRHSFEIDASPEEAQDLFERDILPSLFRGSAFRIAEELPGVLLLSDGLVDVDRPFDARRAAGAGPIPRRSEQEPAPPERPRPRLMGVVAPNVEHRQPWLYANLRRLSSRTLKISFQAEEGRTRVRIAGSADRNVRHALTRLGTPGHWPQSAERGR